MEFISRRKSNSSTFSGELGRGEAGGGNEEGDELAQGQSNERLLGPETSERRHFFLSAELGWSPLVSARHHLSFDSCSPRSFLHVRQANKERVEDKESKACIYMFGLQIVVYHDLRQKR